MTRNIFTLVLIFFLSLSASAQTGVVSGKIVDAKSGDTLMGSTVVIDENNNWAASTDLDGNFTIAKVPAGKHRVKVRYIGYQEKQDEVEVNAGAVTSLKKHADSIQLLVFMGTWCEDSHNIIPKFYSLLETSAFSKEKVTLIGVDRAKKTLSHLTEALNITNVPTIIVMKNGKEIGRVVEYGKYGLFDMELGEILKKLDN